MPGIGQLGIASRDGLTMNLIGPATIVTEDGDQLGKIFVQSLLIWLTMVPCVNGRKDMVVTIA